MHIWHHNNEHGQPTLINFGISISLWDWLFRSAYVPDRPPTVLGVPPEASPPEPLWRQLVWPVRIPWS